MSRNAECIPAMYASNNRTTMTNNAVNAAMTVTQVSAFMAFLLHIDSGHRKERAPEGEMLEARH